MKTQKATEPRQQTPTAQSKSTTQPKSTTQSKSTVRTKPKNTTEEAGPTRNNREPERTELVFILDRSGSMAGLETDTIGGYNSLLKKQQEARGAATVTTVLFDDRVELLHDRIPIQGVRPISEKEYYVRGSTALLDAIGHAITKTVQAQRHTAPDMRADKVLFVITTDGMENASREFSASKIKGMIRREQEEYGWEFLFLGANIDAVATAETYGIAPSRAVNYHADSRGTEVNYQAVSEAITQLREMGTIEESWKYVVEEDYTSRKK